MAKAEEKRADFSSFPNGIFRNKSLSKADKLIIFAICSFIGNDYEKNPEGFGKCKILQNTLIERAGVYKGNVHLLNKSLKRLEASGLLRVVRRANKSHIYEVVFETPQTAKEKKLALLPPQPEPKLKKQTKKVNSGLIRKHKERKFPQLDKDGKPTAEYIKLLWSKIYYETHGKEWDFSHNSNVRNENEGMEYLRTTYDAYEIDDIFRHLWELQKNDVRFKKLDLIDLGIFKSQWKYTIDATFKDPSTIQKKAPREYESDDAFKRKSRITIGWEDDQPDDGKKDTPDAAAAERIPKKPARRLV